MSEELVCIVQEEKQEQQYNADKTCPQCRQRCRQRLGENKATKIVSNVNLDRECSQGQALG